jgi:hypothetical protein
MAGDVSLEVEGGIRIGIDDLRDVIESVRGIQGKVSTVNNVRSCTQIDKKHDRSKTRYSYMENRNEGGRKMRQ